MKKLYIVLAHTGTILSRIIRMWTGDEYTHASIALDEDLNEMYSFGRKNAYIAFIGGFVREGIKFGTFKRFYKSEIGVYELEVTEEQYQKVCDNIANIREHKDEYRFNIWGLVLVAFNKKRNVEKIYYCAEFVKDVLKKSDIDISGLPEVIQPEHFKGLKNTKLIYKGLFKEYKKKNNYMEQLLEFMLSKKRASSH
ncbi:MAG: hypothetical protein IKJ36_05790 [Clostridia bacterium]|nr:hypothetical protein [Clostridia bacterium]